MFSGAFPPKPPADIPSVNLASDELKEYFRLSLGTLHPKEEEKKVLEWTLVLPARVLPTGVWYLYLSHLVVQMPRSLCSLGLEQLIDTYRPSSQTLDLAL